MADDFVKLCTELRKLGATYVRQGDSEASFSGVVPSERSNEQRPPRDDKAAREKAIEEARLKELSRV